jgi:hypothetical protein
MSPAVSEMSFAVDMEGSPAERFSLRYRGAVSEAGMQRRGRVHGAGLCPGFVDLRRDKKKTGCHAGL